MSAYRRGVTAGLGILAGILLAACGGDGDDRTEPSPPPPPPPSPSVSGRVTFDAVPAVFDGSADNGKLDYASAQAKPVRGALIQLMSESGVVASASTDANGQYRFDLPTDTTVWLRVNAQMRRDPGNGASWQVSVRDNTSAGYQQSPEAAALYVMDGQPFQTSAAPPVLDLHAASSWNGQQYAGARAAAPFSILDTIYTAQQRVLQADPERGLPALNIFWSPLNRPAEGDMAVGEIGTSHWNPDTQSLYILGNADVDTDEYDTGVVVHEWGHYFEAKLSRSDSIGGSHSSGDALDMRVAFGEGWGNALAGILRNDPIYIDTSGPQQALAFAFHVGSVPWPSDRSWYSEDTVQYLLFELAGTPGIGFDTIYRVMVDEQRVTPAFTSVFSFASALRNRLQPSAQVSLDALLDSLGISSGPALDAYAQGQLAVSPVALPPGLDVRAVLPVYTALSSAPAEVCVSNASPEANKLGSGRFLRFHAPVAGNYRFEAVDNALVRDGEADSQPEILLFREGRSLGDDDDDAEVEGTGLFEEVFALEAGDYVGHFLNAADLEGDDDEEDDDDEPVDVPSLRCFQISVRAVAS